ncbi:MAG: hypothetical protein HC894_29655, partial [Microcoleus sp. SM1_3_4]|nr:hypothetical protein [Microcoleus sp. SM1_3_4]
MSDIAGLLITCRAGSPRIVKVANKLNKPALPITNSLRYAAPITNSLRYAPPITHYQLPITH